MCACPNPTDNLQEWEIKASVTHLAYAERARDALVIRTKVCYYMRMSKSVYYQGGTLVLREVDAYEKPPAPFRLIKERWRCEGYHYGSVLPYLQEQAVHDSVPRWQPLNRPLQEKREAHDYQVAALAAWYEAGRRGSIVLPDRKSVV